MEVPKWVLDTWTPLSNIYVSNSCLAISSKGKVIPSGFMCSVIKLWILVVSVVRQKKEEKETVFMDLRQTDKNKEESEMNFEVVQRILRLNAAQNRQWVMCIPGLSITFASAAQTQKVADHYCDWSQLKGIKSLAFVCIFHFTKDKFAANLILSIGTYHAEKFAAQRSKSCCPNGLWAVLMDNPIFTKHRSNGKSFRP